MANIGQADEAARKAAEVLLRSTGGRAVKLRLPLPAVAGDVQEQIGLGAPEFQDMELAPVAFRKARAQIKADGTAFWELLVSATCVENLAGSLEGSQTAAAATLFANAYGVLVDGDLLEIESVTSSDVAGLPCVYRVVLRRPLAQAL